MPEFLPCPFCGIEMLDDKMHYYYVLYHPKHEWCLLSDVMVKNMYEEDLRNYWNERKGQK